MNEKPLYDFSNIDTTTGCVYILASDTFVINASGSQYQYAVIGEKLEKQKDVTSDDFTDYYCHSITDMKSFNTPSQMFVPFYVSMAVTAVVFITLLALFYVVHPWWRRSL